MTKDTFNRKTSLLISKLNYDLRKKLVRYYACRIALYGSETCTLKIERKYLEIFEMWCWWRTEKTQWSEKVTNEQGLQRIEEKRTILNNILCRKTNWIGHILRRNSLLHDSIEGQMTEVKGVGRRTQLPDVLRKRIIYFGS